MFNTPSINRYINQSTLALDSCESAPSPRICSARDCDNWVNDDNATHCSTCRPQPIPTPMTGYEVSQAESANPVLCSCGLFYTSHGKDKCFECIGLENDLHEKYQGVM